MLACQFSVSQFHLLFSSATLQQTLNSTNSSFIVNMETFYAEIFNYSVVCIGHGNPFPALHLYHHQWHLDEEILVTLTSFSNVLVLLQIELTKYTFWHISSIGTQWRIPIIYRHYLLVPSVHGSDASWEKFQIPKVNLILRWLKYLQKMMVCYELPSIPGF